jgi:hypothetical protein
MEVPEAERKVDNGDPPKEAAGSWNKIRWCTAAAVMMYVL